MTFRYVSVTPQHRLVPCFGYVSLFPLLMKIFNPSSEELGRQLELLMDPGLLWTPYGLRCGTTVFEFDLWQEVALLWSWNSC